MERIVILGATGFIGTRLVLLLQDRYQVDILTRYPDRYVSTERVRYKAWDPNNFSTNLIDGAKAVINLAGASIAHRWTKERKLLIMRSRVQAAKYVAEAIRAARVKPLLWIQASATGFYGMSSSVVDEGSVQGVDSYLAEVCRLWEEPALCLSIQGVRVVVVRTGLVLSPVGGLWKELARPFRFGFGIVLGSGEQRLPWIALDDEVGALSFLLERRECEGVFNLVAPHGCTMKDLVQRVGRGRFRLFSMRVPTCLVRLLVGADMAREVMLADQRVVPSRLLEAGYQFGCVDLDSVK